MKKGRVFVVSLIVLVLFALNFTFVSSYQVLSVSSNVVCSGSYDYPWWDYRDTTYPTMIGTSTFSAVFKKNFAWDGNSQHYNGIMESFDSSGICDGYCVAIGHSTSSIASSIVCTTGSCNSNHEEHYSYNDGDIVGETIDPESVYPNPYGESSILINDVSAETIENLVYVGSSNLISPTWEVSSTQIGNKTTASLSLSSGYDPQALSSFFSVGLSGVGSSSCSGTAQVVIEEPTVVTPYCGDSICSSTEYFEENCSTCSADCGNCTQECELTPENTLISDFTLSILEDYKKDHHLGDTYLSDGLDELKTSNKCSDCGDKKNEIEGVITSKDPINVSFTVESSCLAKDLELSQLPLKLNYDSGKELIFSVSGCKKVADSNYFCSKVIGDSKNQGDLWTRGSLVDFKISLKKGDEVIFQTPLKYLASSKYNLHMISFYSLLPFSGLGGSEQPPQANSEIFKQAYIDWNIKADINKNIKSIGKPIYYTTGLRYAGRPDLVVLENFFLNKAGSLSGYLDSKDKFDPIKVDFNFDRIIASVDDPEAVGTVCSSFGASNAKGCSCVSGMNCHTFVFSSEGDVPSKVFMHEIGHLYGDLLDEYDINYWTTQKRITNGINNPVGATGVLRFPLCCENKYSCINYTENGQTKYKYTITELILDTDGNPSVVVGNEFVAFDESGRSPKFIEPFVCTQNLRPEEIPESIRNKVLCGSWPRCLGMPYSDPLGNNPVDNNPANAVSYSIMGAMVVSDSNVYGLVYPDNAKCPLKHC